MFDLPLKFVNLTPHPVRVYKQCGSLVEFAPDGTVARLATERHDEAPLDGFRITRQSFAEISGLPAPQPGTYYIVSALVLAALGRVRQDVVAPDTAEGAVRDDKGHIVAVEGFLR